MKAGLEVSTDGGETWEEAALQEPVLDKCHTRFRLPWVWDGAPAVLQSRVTDETGYIQPTLEELVEVRGTDSVYHLNAIHGWGIDSDGEVTNVRASPDDPDNRWHGLRRCRHRPAGRRRPRGAAGCRFA